MQVFRDAEKEIGVPCLSLIVGNRVHTEPPDGQEATMPCVKNNSEEILLKFKVKKFLKDLF